MKLKDGSFMLGSGLATICFFTVMLSQLNLIRDFTNLDMVTSLVCLGMLYLGGLLFAEGLATILKK
ncbi:MAG: hypothetical protein WCV59_03000 [Parcubacteria group bacterium]